MRAAAAEAAARVPTRRSPLAVADLAEVVRRAQTSCVRRQRAAAPEVADGLVPMVPTRKLARAMARTTAWQRRAEGPVARGAEVAV